MEILDDFSVLDLAEWNRATWLLGETQFIADDAHAAASGGQVVLNHVVSSGGPPWEGAEIYRIDPAKCTECVGHFDRPQCREVCPVDCIPNDPEHVESRDQLLAKFAALVATKSAA